MLSKDLRVIIFSADSETLVARDINEWLEQNEVDVVDIKYQIALGPTSPYYSVSALVMYKQL